MARGVSVHTDLNAVDPGHYAGWAGPLTACEADADDMAALARAQGFTPKTLRVLMLSDSCHSGSGA